ncbi:hypothetical protein EJB05_28878, partial [Eragrostis curvula]
MPPRRKNKKLKRTTAPEAEGGEDHISDLHDDLLHRVLCFLPAHDAVRTCVLSRRWCEVWKWKSTGVLRFTEAESWGSPVRFNKFVNDMLSIRELAPLEEIVFKTYLFWPLLTSNAFYNKKEPVRYAEAWIQHALMRDVKVLRVLVNSRDRILVLHTPFVSQHLRTLELKTTVLGGCSMDFSRCPALKDLEMTDCKIKIHRILSRSLRRLCFNSICTRIVAPNLLSLRLDVRHGSRVPLLGSMPLLVTAYVYLGNCSRDRSWHNKFEQCDSDTCIDCYGNHAGSNSCVLLESLSNVTDLELAAYNIHRYRHLGVAIFKNDMQLAPTFNMLKTLVLSRLVGASEVHQLINFLRHAPVLKKISLELFEEHEYVAEIEESCRLLEERLLPSDHLKIIQVSCSRGKDGRFDKLVKFMDTCSRTVQAGLLASMLDDAPVSESEMILQRRLHHHGAKQAEHFLIKWNCGPPASLAIWESNPGRIMYCPPVTTTATENFEVKQSSKRIRKPNSLYPASLWIK